jgi:predicted alpha/beta-fold hydrolase
METKPSLYQKKDEESLRDQFLFVLESRYESTTATGETFNHNGRADILLKYAKDSSNLFVAECKLWYGASEFINGISQLFDRYLTWRDSKTALLLFVKNKDFSNVLFTIKDEVKKHPYFVRENGLRGDSSFSYIFRLPQDPQKEVLFEIIAFHFYS